MSEQMRLNAEKKQNGQMPNHTNIPTQMKLDFEKRSGLSFDDVRVHYHSDKPAKIGALAYTQGNQVYVGPGQERHLRHELGHVVQQKLGLVQPTTWINGLPVNDSPRLEHMADQRSSAAMQVHSPSAAVLQKQPIDKETAEDMIWAGKAGSPYIKKMLIQGHLCVDRIAGKVGDQAAILVCPSDRRLKTSQLNPKSGPRRNHLQHNCPCYRSMSEEEFAHLSSTGLMKQNEDYQGLAQTEEYSEKYLNEDHPYLVEFLFCTDPLQYLVDNSTANYKSEKGSLSVGLGEANTRDERKKKPPAIDVFNQQLGQGGLYWQLIRCYVKIDH